MSTSQDHSPNHALTPGAYLKRRRQAAGLSLADVAARLETQPRLAEHLRADWLERIEADIQPATFQTIVALREAYSFDLLVLLTLVNISLGIPVAPPALCRICACSDDDICCSRVSFRMCDWVEPDLCSFCSLIDPQPAPRNLIA